MIRFLTTLSFFVAFVALSAVPTPVFANGQPPCEQMDTEPSCSPFSYDYSQPGLPPTLTANPQTINAGQGVTVTWETWKNRVDMWGPLGFVGTSYHSSGAGCVSSQFDTGYAPSGSAVVYPTVTTTYTISCDSDTQNAAYYNPSTGRWEIAQMTDKTAQVTVYVQAPDLIISGGVSPGSATVGIPVTFSATAQNVGAGNAYANPYIPTSFQIIPTAGGALQVIPASAINNVGSSQSAGFSGAKTFASDGQYNVRACVDIGASSETAVAESNEGNNCGAWTTVTVDPAAACSATPDGTTVAYNATSHQITAYNVSSANTSVRFPTWTEVNGQDDIVWYNGTKTGPNTWTTTVNPSSHSGSGLVNVHVYRDSTFCDSANFTKSAPAALCANGIDDDSDGATDYPADSGCSGTTDTTEAPNPATASLSATPTTVRSGESSALTWSSSGAGSCTGTGFSTGGATSGSVSTGALTNPTNNYSVTCGTATAVTSVSVSTPTAYITAEPTLVTTGSTNLKWNASGVSTCTITSNQSGPSFTSSYTPVIAGTTTTAVTGVTKQTYFTLTCTPLVGAAISSSVLVNIRSNFDEF